MLRSQNLLCCSEGHDQQLFSLVAHGEPCATKVVGGEAAQAVVKGVLKNNVADWNFFISERLARSR